MSPKWTASPRAWGPGTRLQPAESEGASRTRPQEHKRWGAGGACLPNRGGLSGAGGLPGGAGGHAGGALSRGAKPRSPTVPAPRRPHTLHPVPHPATTPSLSPPASPHEVRKHVPSPVPGSGSRSPRAPSPPRPPTPGPGPILPASRLHSRLLAPLSPAHTAHSKTKIHTIDPAMSPQLFF